MAERPRPPRWSDTDNDTAVYDDAGSDDDIGLDDAGSDDDIGLDDAGSDDNIGLDDTGLRNGDIGLEGDTAYVGRAGVSPGMGESDERELPEIDPAELAALAPIAEQPSRVSRVSPLSDEPSTLVARYLFPTERYRGEWRRHIVHLATPLTIGVGATVLLGFGAGYVQAQLGVPLLVPVVIVAWVLVMGWVAWKIAFWHFDRFILTNKRVMKVSGIITRDVAMMPLLRVTDMKYEQTPVGRILNYGTFVIESAGQDQALREIPHLPNPNELYLRVVEEMYDPGAVEARVDEPEESEENERTPGGDA